MPSLTVDYLVLGAFVGTLVFNESTAVFDRILPHNIDNCKITNIPIHGVDPVIDLVPSEDLKNLFKSKDERVLAILNKLPQNLTEGFKKGQVALEPASTIYIARNNFSTRSQGLSLYRRLLPIYFLEKVMLRGTIEAASRRMRGILHLRVGDDNWEPTADNLNDLANLFQQADSDPINAIVATRQSIETNEVRQGQDFWRYDEIYDTVSSWKMRALGANEAFITGEASYNSLEQSLSVFMEQIRSYRSRVTREFFYQKVFPGIAVANNFVKDTRFSVTGNYENYGLRNSRIKQAGDKSYYGVCAGDMHTKLDEIDDITKYQIPTLVWHKQLKPEADDHYMDMLSRASEQGIPVPIRMMATAAGLNLDKILEGQEEDLSVRQKVADYVSEINSGNTVTSAFGNGVKRRSLKDRLAGMKEEDANFKRNKSGNKVPMSAREIRSRDERVNKQMVEFAKVMRTMPVESNPYG